ncbi:MAG: TrkA C-terminal domain-containing protein [Phycisphaerales bacterium]
MVGIISLFIVAAVAFFVVRLGATALERTGLSRESAQFQAVSAFFGAGFTTGESELVVNHPVRRRIIRDLIVVGNIGLTGALGAIIITFVRTASTREQGLHLGVLVVGVAALWALSRSRVALRLIDRTVDRLGPSARVHVHDYARLLRLHSGFGVDEVNVEEGSEVAGRTLAELALRSEQGVMVLGIARQEEEFFPTPQGGTRLRAGDALTVYGKDSDVARFARRCVRPEARDAAGDSDR